MFNASVGTPGQNFWFSPTMTSSDVWIPSSNCSPSTCVDHNRFDASKSATFHEVGSPFKSDIFEEWITVGGHISSDVLHVANLKIENQTFGEVTEHDERKYSNWEWVLFDGAFGLGLSRLSSNGITSPLHNMIETGILDSSQPTFSLWLNSFKEESGTDAFTSELVIGGINRKNYFGDLIELPLREKAVQWEVELDSLAIGAERTSTPDAYVQFDIAKNYIGLPSSFFTYL